LKARKSANRIECERSGRPQTQLLSDGKGNHLAERLHSVLVGAWHVRFEVDTQVPRREELLADVGVLPSLNPRPLPQPLLHSYWRIRHGLCKCRLPNSRTRDGRNQLDPRGICAHRAIVCGSVEQILTKLNTPSSCALLVIRALPDSKISSSNPTVASLSGKPPCSQREKEMDSNCYKNLLRRRCRVRCTCTRARARRLQQN
jgi:hypothetical protein